MIQSQRRLQFHFYCQYSVFMVFACLVVFYFCLIVLLFLLFLLKLAYKGNIKCACFHTSPVLVALSFSSTSPAPLICLFEINTFSSDIFHTPLTFLFRAQHIFSEFLLAMKASLALWIAVAVKFSVNILLLFVCIYAGCLLIKVEGSFGFSPRASWNWEKPWTFTTEFFALIYYDNAKLIPIFDSSRTLCNISPIIKLCLSTKPFLNGAFAVLSLNTILINFHISIKSEFANSPRLSDKFYYGIS